MSVECLPGPMNGIGKSRRKHRAVAGFPSDLSGYSPIELICYGTSGAVYRARQRSTGRDVAVKLFHPDKGPAYRAQLRHCVRNWSVPSHPHIACLIDAGRTAVGRFYTIAEYVPGETLRRYLIKNGALSSVFAATIMAQLLDALASLHASGIIHRDIKPENILLTATGARTNVKLIDFSITARTAQRGRWKDAIWGTPAYCSPEQLRGEPPDPAADLYAWGLVFLECLTGVAAVPNLLPADVIGFHLSAETVSLPWVLRGHNLEPLLREVLAKDGQSRASDAVALHARLQNYLNAENAVADAPAMIPPEGAPERWHAASVLCVSTALVPLSHCDSDVAVLARLQEEQRQSCLQVLQNGGGRLIGTIDHRLLFHFGGADRDEGLWRAALTWGELRSDFTRRNRLLEIRYGISVDLQAGLAWEEVGQDDALALAIHAALRLHRLASPGRFALHPAAQARLCQILTGEEYDGLGCAKNGSE